MPNAYEDWIAAYATRVGSVYMMCLEASTEMVQQFPELTLIKGAVVSAASGKRYCHCWCKTPAGQIVDPTKQQFGNAQIKYEEYKGSNRG